MSKAALCSRLWTVTTFLGVIIAHRWPAAVIPLLSITALIAQNSTPKRAPDVPYVPTTEAAVREMLKLADVRSADVVYDLGCGDGRIVIAAAKIYGAHGVGIDIDPARIKEAKENARIAGVENLVRFEENDLLKTDIRQATVVTLFLSVAINLQLRPKLRELKPGARIVSNTFDMGDWKAEKESTVGEPDALYEPLSRQLYLWIVPPRKTPAP